MDLSVQNSYRQHYVRPALHAKSTYFLLKNKSGIGGRLFLIFKEFSLKFALTHILLL